MTFSCLPSALFRRREQRAAAPAGHLFLAAAAVQLFLAVDAVDRQPAAGGRRSAQPHLPAAVAQPPALRADQRWLSIHCSHADSPLHAVSSFQEQVAAVQQSSQQLVQSLKQELEATKTQVAEKTAELRGLVDANLALKQELGKLQEAAKEAAEAEGKRKAECETLIAQIGKLNSQAAAEAETAKGREENLTIALGAARETAEKVVHALQTLQTGFQQLVSSGAFQSGPLQWNVRNVSGAANFAINQLVELSKSVGTSVGKEEE